MGSEWGKKVCFVYMGWGEAVPNIGVSQKGHCLKREQEWVLLEEDWRSQAGTRWEIKGEERLRFIQQVITFRWLSKSQRKQTAQNKPWLVVSSKYIPMLPLTRLDTCILILPFNFLLIYILNFLMKENENSCARKTQELWYICYLLMFGSYKEIGGSLFFRMDNNGIMRW